MAHSFTYTLMHSLIYSPIYSLTLSLSKEKPVRFEKKPWDSSQVLQRAPCSHSFLASFHRLHFILHSFIYLFFSPHNPTCLPRERRIAEGSQAHFHNTFVSSRDDGPLIQRTTRWLRGMKVKWRLWRRREKRLHLLSTAVGFISATEEQRKSSQLGLEPADWRETRNSKQGAGTRSNQILKQIHWANRTQLDVPVNCFHPFTSSVSPCNYAATWSC